MSQPRTFFKDSENLMDLLRDLTLKGKLVITVIHQPSSGIFKMFDKIAILDQDGFMVFGNRSMLLFILKLLMTRLMPVRVNVLHVEM